MSNPIWSGEIKPEDATTEQIFSYLLDKFEQSSVAREAMFVLIDRHQKATKPI